MESKLGGIFTPILPTGLSRSLEDILSNKLQGIKQQQISRGLQSLGTDPAASLNLSSINPNLLGQNLGLQQQQGQIQSPQDLQELLSILGQQQGVPGQQQPQPLQPQQEAVHLIEKSPLTQEDKKPKITAAQREKNRSEIRKDIKEYIKDKKRVDQRISTLNRFEDLDIKGEIDSPGKIKFFKSLGLDFLLSPGSQEFESGIKEFLGDLKPLFGGKVSDFEVNTFLRAVPQLSNSKEGRKRISRNLKTLYEAQKLEAQTAIDVARENKELDPLEFTLEVDKRVEKRRQELADELNESLKGNFKSEKDIPEGVIVRKNGKEFVKKRGRLVPK